MPADFQMPKLGLTMEEGTIVDWLVDDGAEITAGSPVLLIETDKTETEVEAAHTGTLRITAAVGETYPCGAVIGQVFEAGESVEAADGGMASPEPAPSPAEPTASTHTAEPDTTGEHGVAQPIATAASPPAHAGGRLVASPNARRVAAELDVDLATVRGTGPGGRITSEDVEDVSTGRVAPRTTAPASAPAAASASVTAPAAAAASEATTTAAASVTASASAAAPASIAARQLADLLGVDLAAVAPDPVDGRVTRDGVAAHVRALLAGAPGRAPAAGTSVANTRSATGGAAPALQEPTEVIRLSGMRGTIAKRMYGSLQDMAQLTLTMDADMDAVVIDRAARKDAGNAPGFTDYVIAAAARALRDHPRMNAQITDEGVALLPDVHVGVAVAIDDGLIVPVIEHTDRLTLGQLGPETTRLAEAARAGTLTPDEATGGTFSVTALGMFGVDAFTPVVNPPNAGILGVGRLRDDLILVDGEVRTTTRLTLSLTWDHRVLDGAPAAEFARTICDYLASPSRLV